MGKLIPILKLILILFCYSEVGYIVDKLCEVFHAQDSNRVSSVVLSLVKKRNSELSREIFSRSGIPRDKSSARCIKARQTSLE